MRHRIASQLNDLGSKYVHKGKFLLGERLYMLATKVDPLWSVPFYNLGLHYKNTSRWYESMRFNQLALSLDSTDEAAWWNLGIAATALKNWTEARHAWKSCGIEIEDVDGEVRIPCGSACVRLDPNNSGEVVWGERIDPARIVVLNVPLPESGYRFNDIILNDGAQNGSRVNKIGTEVPVFDELAVWQISDYSTFSVKVRVPDADGEQQLVSICDRLDLGLEDWSTVRKLCAECSRGNPGPHKCEAKPLEDGTRRFGFGAKSKEALVAALAEWAAAIPSAEFGDPELLLSAKRV